MEEGMIDLIAGDVRLRRRLEAYADARLTPDAATAARIRARVLAVAHRRAELARADAALTVVRTAPQREIDTPRHRRGTRRRAATALLAAALAVGLAAGTTLAARPGGALYEARLWVETVTLPRDPSERALAELQRLDARLAEAAEAIRAGDTSAAVSALAAYEQIVDEATAAAVGSGDEVASAVLRTGVGHNVEVLQALVTSVPDQAADAIAGAIVRAIARSDGAIHAIEDGQNGSNGRPGGQPAGQPGGPDAKPTKAPPDPTRAPTPKPTPTKASGGGQNAGQGDPHSQPPGHQKPDTTPAKPAKSPRPTPTH
jgi:hypothetical protein